MKAREGKDGYQLVEVVLRFNSIGKLTEGWTDFAPKGGNLIRIMGIDASMPGKSAPHLVYLT
jgi:hypothetical protein